MIKNKTINACLVVILIAFGVFVLYKINLIKIPSKCYDISDAIICVSIFDKQYWEKDQYNPGRSYIPPLAY